MILRNKNFLNYLFITTFATIASNLIQFILSLYILDLTKSASIFALCLSIIILPRLFLTPIAGFVSDKFNKRCLLLILLNTYIITLIIFYILFNTIDNKVILIIFLISILECLETFLGVVNSSLIPFIVKEEFLSKANAISSIDDTIVEILNPIIATTMYTLIGIENSILLCTLFYILCLIFSFKLCIKFTKKLEKEKISFFKDLIYSFKHTTKKIIDNKQLLVIILSIPIINLFMSSAFSITMVILLREVLNISDKSFGVFQSIVSLSSVIGAILSTKILENRKISSILSNSVIIISIIFFIIFILTRFILSLSIIPIILILDCIVVIMVTISNISITTLLQNLFDK